MDIPSSRSSRPEIRAPRKSAGVPREARGGTLVAALCHAAAPCVEGETLRAAVEAAGFYDTPLLAQAELLARLVVEQMEPARALTLVEASPDARVRGLGPVVVRLYLLESLPEAVEHLRRQAVLPGTGVQEGAQIALKRLCVRHGLEQVLPLVDPWLTDLQADLRRCLVEALRPRGVWSGHLPELRRDPAPLRPRLERVLDDPSLYVRKAVANCLNDVSKDHADLLLEWAAGWSAAPAGPERAWILRHGLRGLVKAGHPGALRLVGVEPCGELRARWSSLLPERVELNQRLEIEVAVENPGSEPRGVLVVGTLAGPGAGARPRVRRYRLAEGTAPAGGSARLVGRLHFVDYNSQPRLDGEYTLELSVNGEPLERRSFRFERAARRI